MSVTVLNPSCLHWFANEVQAGGGCRAGVANGKPSYRACSLCPLWKASQPAEQQQFTRWYQQEFQPRRAHSPRPAAAPALSVPVVPTATPAAPDVVQAKRAWLKMQNLWAAAESLAAAAQSRGFLATGKQALGLSDTAGERVSPEIFAQRQAACFGAAGQRSCVMLRRQGARHWCGACGCGKNKLAWLDGPQGERDYAGVYVKLHYPKLQCPLGRPGFDAPA